MAEYIERSKVIELLKGTEVNGTPYMKRIVKATVDLAIEAISDDVFVADVAPVVRGHWLTWDEKFPGNAVGKNLGVFCSVCGNHSDYSSPYCPNCGAKMDEGDGNENLS